MLKIVGARLEQTHSLYARQSAVALLGKVKPSEPRQLAEVVVGLLRVYLDSPESNDLPNRGDLAASAADALAMISRASSDQAEAVVHGLLSLVSSGEWLPRLREPFESPRPDLTVVREIGPEPRKEAVATLLTLLSGGDRRAEHSAAIALSLIAPIDPVQRSAALDALLKIMNREPALADVVGAALAANTSGDPGLRRIAVATLLSLAKERDGYDRLRVFNTLAWVPPNDADQRRQLVAALNETASNKNDQTLARSSKILAVAAPIEPDQQRVLLPALLRLVRNENGFSRYEATFSLTVLNPTDSSDRTAVTDAVLDTLPFWRNFIPSPPPNWLHQIGPVDANRVARLLAFSNKNLPRAGPVPPETERLSPRVRAVAWVLNGALPVEANGALRTDNEGAILLTFVGRPGSVPPSRWPKSPKDAGPILAAFDKHWAATTTSPDLQKEIAEQTVAIVSHACPTAAIALSNSSLQLFEAAVARTAQEWTRTASWLQGWFGHGGTRCWDDGARTSIESLRDRFDSVENHDLYQDKVNAGLEADGAPPYFGGFVLAAGGWWMVWTAFLIAFPYSRRLRGLYLHNGRARRWLSLNFLPAVMAVMPFLRRRMLLPFREELLADAHLETLNRAEIYPNLRVRDRQGTMHPIGKAIPDVRGKILLIGESGLGKSTYLRVLASGSRRTVAYLNAGSCAQGVVAAIVERVRGFESAEFFKGLIYSGDLAIIIDGLNEVGADVRAQIVNFANEVGRANVIMATQPIEGLGSDRSPLTLATPYELLPLARDDIAKFLKSRRARDGSDSCVKGEHYDIAVDTFLTNMLDRVPASDEERETERVLQFRRSAEIVLSNPMDLTYCSELIAIGENPHPSDMIEQAFRLARDRYYKNSRKDFPTLDFARKAVELRRDNRNWLWRDEFPNEQDALAAYRLIVPATVKESLDKEVAVMRFRHDKVMDVIMKPAFEANKGVQGDLIEDPRFRGVCLLFAQAADRKQARRILRLLVSHAAKTSDNSLSNPFVLLFDEVETVSA